MMIDEDKSFVVKLDDNDDNDDNGDNDDNDDNDDIEEGHQINDVCVTLTGRSNSNISELTLPPFALPSPSSSPSPSPATRNNFHRKRPQSKLQQPPPPLTTQPPPRILRDRVLQCRHNIVQAASAIDRQNTIELESTRERRRQKTTRFKREEEQRLRAEAQVEMEALTTVKLREKLERLEGLKVEVLGFRAEKRGALRCFVGRERRRRVEEESPSRILRKTNYVSFGSDEGDDDGGEGDDDGGETMVGRDSGRLSGAEDETPHESNEATTIEEMRMAARAEVAEEIRMAKEVRRHQMEQLATEREEATLALAANNDDDNDDCKGGPIPRTTEDLIAGVQIGTICKLLDCTREELYDDDVSDSSFEPAIEMMERSSENTTTVRRLITDLMQTIDAYDIRLADIELMQSVVLAEIAALRGKDEFKVGGGGGEGGLRHDGTTDCGLSRADDSRRRRIPQWEGLDRVTKGIGQKIRTFQLAAARVDRYRIQKSR